MATQTTNLELVKPDLTDIADIAVINTNMDKIDAQINFIRCPPYAGITTHSGNAYAVSYTGFGYTDGWGLVVKFDADSTGAATLSVNGKTAIPIIDSDNLPVSTIKSGMFAVLRYNATSSNFQLTSKGGIPNVTAGDTVTLYLSYNSKGFAGAPNPWTEVDHVTVGKIAGKIRITTFLQTTSSEYSVSGQVYRNSVPIGTVHVTYDTNGTNFTEDIPAKYKDRISLYMFSEATMMYGNIHQIAVNEHVNPIY